MARTVTAKQFQDMQRDVNGTENVAEMDPLTGRIVAKTERATAITRLVADVASDGIVEGVRPAEMTPDRGPDVGTTVHTVGDQPRFSGGGTSDDESPVSRLIPSDGAFLNERHKAAPELANIARRLIEEHGFFGHLDHCRIDYKWRRKGSNAKGKRTIGGVSRVSGIWSAYVPFNFVVWLAADTARMAGFTDRQVEAAIFHQLCHLDQDAKGNWIKASHDFEGFGAEVRHYGAWTADLMIGSEAFTVAVQLGLDLEADDEEDEDDGPADPDADFPDDGEDLEDLPTDEQIDQANAERGG